ncbi:MAG: cation-translocating P-type ATPase [Bdellovibrionales bacterium]|nr:cation-translocating P-type ATPase [Bdellovibrionales bacterium]
MGHDNCNHGHGHHHSHSHSSKKVVESNNGYDRSNLPSDAVEEEFKVSGMDCADEIAAINSSLKAPDIYIVEANLMSSTVKVVFSDKTKKEDVERRINRSGVKVVSKEGKTVTIPFHRLLYVCISGALFLASFVISYINGVSEFLTMSGFLISIAFGSILVVPKATRALRKFHLDMNVLVVVAALGAIYLRDYAEAAAVIFLFALSELLEAYSVVRARKAISEVLKITPKSALLRAGNGELTEVEASSLKIGDVVVARAGDLIPADGTVKAGESDVNQAALTGESKLVKKAFGDIVYAGTINSSAVLDIQVSQLSKDSKVSQIIKLVEDAQKSKAPLQTFVDQFARIYTPAVFLLALAIMMIPPLVFQGAWNDWIYKSLVLLVIACPCALVISTPVSIASALTAMARRGVLVKGGKFLEGLGKLRAVALDKTGTLTEGTPQVVSVRVWDQTKSIEDILKVAASIEASSNHPLAQAVVRYAKENKISASPVSEVQSAHGRGVFAKLDGHEYFLGNHRFVHELGVCSTELESYLAKLEDKSLSVIVVGHKPHADCEGEVMGIIWLGDKLKANAKLSVDKLHSLGCEAVVILSGDNQRTTTAIGSSVNVDAAFGDLLPENKVEKVKELVQKYKYVGMVGDGVNDAPALASATVGIAMGLAGTDAAVETADVTLVKDDLSQLAVAIEQGQRALGIIRFNIGFALVLKIIFLALALLGYSSMWMAVAADTGATLIVILNALRLLKVD